MSDSSSPRASGTAEAASITPHDSMTRIFFAYLLAVLFSAKLFGDLILIIPALFHHFYHLRLPLNELGSHVEPTVLLEAVISFFGVYVFGYCVAWCHYSSCHISASSLTAPMAVAAIFGIELACFREDTCKFFFYRYVFKKVPIFGLISLLGYLCFRFNDKAILVTFVKDKTVEESKQESPAPSTVSQAKDEEIVFVNPFKAEDVVIIPVSTLPTFLNPVIDASAPPAYIYPTVPDFTVSDSK